MATFRPTAPLCDNLRISQSVNYTGGALIINIPAGSYDNNDVYGIVVAQAIPSAATVGAPVVITIGSGTVQYPLLRCNGVQATAGSISTRTRYLVRVVTNTTSGAFRMLGRACGCNPATLPAISGATPVTMGVDNDD